MEEETHVCNECGNYGDIICGICKMIGCPNYYYCEECIEAHIEEHGQEE